MGSSGTTRIDRRRRPRALGVLAVALAAIGLAACDPPPPPDGRDLGIEATDTSTDVAPGETVEIEAVVTNHGDAVATGARVGFLAPDHLTVDDVAGEGVSNCVPVAVGGRCDLADVAPGASLTVTFTVSGADAGPATLTLLVGSAAGEPDPDPHPNAAILPIAVGTGATVDLQVQGELPATIVADTPFTSRTWVTNRSSSAAAEVEVTQQVPAGATILDSRFRNTTPGDDGTGSCTVVDRTVTCTAGAALVEPTTNAAHRWVLEVDVVAGSGWFTTTHSVGSPHPEPVPDPGPNTATTQRYVDYAVIVFDPVPPVAVGTEFDVSGTVHSPGPIPVYYASISVPQTLEAVSVTSGGQTIPCQPGGSCTVDPYLGIGPGVPVTMRLRAVSAGRPASVTLSVSAIGVGLSGTAKVQVIDPRVVSEVHPYLAATADGVQGVPQTILGEVRSTGSTDHASVTATLEAPAGLGLLGARWGVAGLPCAVQGSTATCEVGEVPAYGSVGISVEVVPEAAGPTSLTMTTASPTPQDDPDPEPDTTSVAFDVAAAEVDLGLTSTLSHDPAVEGVNWQVTTTVTNHGTVAAGGTSLIASVPAGVTVNSPYLGAGAPEDSGECTVIGEQISCEVGTLGPGRTARMHIISQVAAGTTGTLEISATSDHAEPVPDPHPNTFTHEVEVVSPRADLRASYRSDLSDTVYVGQPATIGFVAYNLGPSTVPTAVTTLQVPAGLSITGAGWSSSYSGARQPCTVAGTTATCTTASINPLSSAYMDVTVVADQPATGLEVTGTVTSDLPDDVAGNNESVRSITAASAEVDVGVRSSHSPTVTANTPASIDVRVRNTGPADAIDTTLTAVLPASVHVDEVFVYDSGFTCSTTAQVLTCTHPRLTRTEELLRVRIRHMAVGPVTFTADVTTSTPQEPDDLPNAVEITQTVDATPARISGTVVDTTGAPVTNMSIGLYRVGDATAQAWLDPAADGSYQFSSVAPGEYQVLYSPRFPTGLQSEWFDDVIDRSDATVFTTAGLGEQFTADAELALIPRTTVRGTVVDEVGQPVAGVNVAAYRPTDGLVGSHFTTTAADGTYAMILLDGEYKVRFGPPASAGLIVEWFDDQPGRSSATTIVASGSVPEVVADATLAPAAT